MTALGQAEADQGFPYGEVVRINDPFKHANSIVCSCVNLSETERIEMLARRRSMPSWQKLSETFLDRVMPNNLLVTKVERGWVAIRCWRGSVGSAKYLTHRLSDTPILLPTSELASAAAELCTDRPHPRLGWMGWTVPVIS